MIGFKFPNTKVRKYLFIAFAQQSLGSLGT